MEKLLILDSNSLMNRAFYALPPLTNDEGVHTNAIYGFTNMLLKMKDDINPDYIVAAFDRKAPTFRHKEYGDYKAGRKNPFSAVTTTETGNTTQTNTTGNTNTSNSGSTTNTDSTANAEKNNTSNSTNYYPDKGIK